MKPTELLSIRNWTVSYPGADWAAVDRVTLYLAPGEVLGLIGESGCGKSTLGRSLLRAVGIDGLPPGTEVTGTLDWRGGTMGLVFQDPMTRLNPLMSIREHGLEVLRSHHPRMLEVERRRRVADTLRAVGLDPGRSRQFPHEFSGGMRQRVGIALALLLEPDLVIADEPTTSLDATVAHEILRELCRLCRDRQKALLLISHDLGMVGQYCDRLAVMDDGAIVECRATQAMYAQPQHPYTRQLLQTHLPQSGIPPESAPLLRVQDLSKSYAGGGWGSKGRVLALDQVSFTVCRGELLGIIGESGSGKSTLARLLLHLIPPDHGTVWFQQQNLTTLKGPALRKLRSQMQLIVQDPRASLPPHRTIAEILAEPLEIHQPQHPNIGAAMLEILDRVELPRAYAQRRPRDLSGGQLQRVAIARALIMHPQLVICDEPVSMLDVTIQNQILELLLSLQQQEGLTYVLITHDLRIARALCHRILILHRGRAVELGPTAEVFAHPQHPYTQQLLQNISA
ncbi:MAG: ABC transporter ATP-binding protein [Oscillatoriales cyanobacterium SM2_2_1]|nr:ABC transporter ATP-binding protein [Oscillatoriales cyanobacterium SM2_2_1]